MLDAWRLEQATFAGAATRLSRPGKGPRSALQISRIMHQNLGQTISVGWPVQELGANLRVCLCHLLALTAAVVGDCRGSFWGVQRTRLLKASAAASDP